jgi:hypothetical protein
MLDSIKPPPAIARDHASRLCGWFADSDATSVAPRPHVVCNYDKPWLVIACSSTPWSRRHCLAAVYSASHCLIAGTGQNAFDVKPLSHRSFATTTLVRTLNLLLDCKD